ncbi:MAG: CDP-glycerol glycerophosphotransferase family protein [Clostridia bacterium]|nr:CDP-glycerol glycerophosphotransferase family protein [Clostridia bacterium]
MNRLSYLLKSSRLLYEIYFFVMSALLKMLGILVGYDAKLILFNCFGGKQYADSPKAIYESMLSDPRFDGYRFVWALHAPERFSIPGRSSVIKADSFKYFVTALRAGIWITNSSMERGLSFKKKKTLCFNTWHGTPIKTMGADIKEENLSFKSRVLVRADIMCAQGQYDVDVFSRAFRLPVSHFRMTGLPRNDILASYTPEMVCRIKEKLGIGKEKTVLLYAPTFREYARGESNEIVLDIPMNLSKWQEALGDRFVVLFRAHYEVAKHMKLAGYPVFLDMSAYPDLNELMIVSDALISDYSSIFFDYSIMGKPMYCFAYDMREYGDNRGMYLRLTDELPCEVHQREDSLIDQLLKIDEEKEALSRRTVLFQRKYVTEFGHGAKKCCDAIAGMNR